MRKLDCSSEFRRKFLLYAANSCQQEQRALVNQSMTRNPVPTSPTQTSKQYGALTLLLISALSGVGLFLPNQRAHAQQSPEASVVRSGREDVITLYGVPLQSPPGETPPVAIQPEPPAGELPPDGVHPPGTPIGNPGLPPETPMVPLTWELRGGGSASGAVSPGLGDAPGTGVYGAGNIGFRLFLNGGSHSIGALLNIALGTEGLNFGTLDLHTFRLRYPFNRDKIFWFGVAVADLDLQVSTSPAMRSRFGLRPNAMVGVMTRLGGSSCVLHLFAQAGLELLGFGQTQADPLQNFLHPMTGAEATLECRNIHVDLSYIHLFGMNYRGGEVFNGVDTNRVSGDIGLRLGSVPVGGNQRLGLGPYLQTQVSQEYGDPTASEAANHNNRVFHQTTLGLRVDW